MSVRMRTLYHEQHTYWYCTQFCLEDYYRHGQGVQTVGNNDSAAWKSSELCVTRLIVLISKYVKRNVMNHKIVCMARERKKVVNSAICCAVLSCDNLCLSISVTSRKNTIHSLCIVRVYLLDWSIHDMWHYRRETSCSIKNKPWGEISLTPINSVLCTSLLTHSNRGSSEVWWNKLNGEWK